MQWSQLLVAVVSWKRAKALKKEGEKVKDGHAQAGYQRERAERHADVPLLGSFLTFFKI